MHLIPGKDYRQPGGRPLRYALSLGGADPRPLSRWERLIGLVQRRAWNTQVAWFGRWMAQGRTPRAGR